MRSINISTKNPITNRKLFAILKDKNDVIFMSDTRANSENQVANFNDVRKKIQFYGYKAFFNSRTSLRGVAILISNKIALEIINRYDDDEGNILMIDCILSGCRVLLVSIYGPNENNNNFFNQLRTNIPQLKNGPIIMGGDFNATFDTSPEEHNIDTINMQSIPSPVRSRKILEICNEFNLCDPFRVIYPLKKDFTYIPAAIDHENRSRIDFFLISKEIMGEVKDCKISNSLLTTSFDHKAIILKFKKIGTPKKISVFKTVQLTTP
jgi:exonuclease III